MTRNVFSLAVLLACAVPASAYAESAVPFVRQPTFRPGTVDVTDSLSALETPSVAAPFGWYLEFDCGDVITNAVVDGKPVVLERSRRSWWMGAERGLMLPEGERHAVVVRTNGNRILYPNGYGRVQLAPATIDQVLRPKEVESVVNELCVANVSPRALTCRVQVVYADFFGVTLSTAEATASIAANGTAAFPLGTPPARFWRAEYRLTSNGETSFPYRFYPDKHRWFTARDAVVPFEGQFPALFNPPKERRRTKPFSFSVDVPADWRGQRILIGVPCVHYKADFKVNGKPAGSLCHWETPAKLDVTGLVEPGHRLTLEADVTDLTVCKAAHATLAAPGQGLEGVRTLAAAVGHLPAGALSGFKSRLVLLAEPETRTESVGLTCAFRNGHKFLAAALDVKGTAEAECAIYRAGKLVRALGAPVREWQVDELASWTPETPVLYEFRVTLRKDRRTVDVTRWRFGFRELGIDGRYFTLNGEPFRFLGFSQLYVSSLTWPAVPQPANFARWNFHDDTHMMGGAGMVNLSDELGVFVKGENMAHNAHAGERYDYGHELIWTRIASEMKNVIRCFRNAPSAAFWDVGNELSFSGPGEPERCGRLFGEIQAFDPTRPVTVSGCIYHPVGPDVRIYDEHGGVGLASSVPEIAARTRPFLFSECMYMHASLTPGLCGDDIFTLPPLADRYAELPNVQSRRYALRNARRDGVAAALGHLTRHHGREISPVVAFPRDGRLRFCCGERMLLPYDVFNGLSRPTDVTVRFVLRENGRPVAERTARANVGLFGRAAADVDFGVFEAASDRRFDLFVDLVAADGAVYRDYETVTVFAPQKAQLPADVRLSVVDADGRVAAWLTRRGVPFSRLKTEADWRGGANESLYVFGGGDVSGTFPEVPQLTKADAHAVCPRGDLAESLAAHDLRFWSGLGNGGRVASGLLDMPQGGAWRILAAGGDHDGLRFEHVALADFAARGGTVRVSRFDLAGALGRDPAADRLLAWMVTHPPKPFGRPDVRVVTTSRTRRALALRAGVFAFADGFGDLNQVRRVVTDAVTLSSLDASARERWQQWLRSGGQALVLNAGDGARFACGRARPVAEDPILEGLSTGDLFWFDGKSGSQRSLADYDESKGEDAQAVATHLVAQEPGDVPLLKPAYLVRRSEGRGTAYLTSLDLLASETPEAARTLATLLVNFGVPLDRAKAEAGAAAAAREAVCTKEVLSLASLAAEGMTPMTALRLDFASVKGATVRVWNEDRATWIPGMPLPYVDVRVLPGAVRAWDNPSVEKKVTGLEVREGRLSSCTLYRPKAPRPVSGLLPKLKPGMVLDQVEWSDFGLVLAKDGSLPLLYRREDGKPIVSFDSWFLQERTDVDGKPHHRTLPGPGKSARVTRRGDVLTVDTASGWLDVRTTYALRPGGMDITWEATPKQSVAADARINLMYSGTILGGGAWSGGTVNARPLSVRWEDQSATIAYDRSYTWHHGYWTGGKTSFTFSPYNNTGRTYADGKLSVVRVQIDFQLR